MGLLKKKHGLWSWRADKYAGLRVRCWRVGWYGAQRVNTQDDSGCDQHENESAVFVIVKHLEPPARVYKERGKRRTVPSKAFGVNPGDKSRVAC